MSKLKLVAIITVAFAGRTPFVGSTNCPQPPAAKISAFRAATLEAVVAFFINPCQSTAVTAHSTFILLVLSAVPPTLKRTISFNPSSAPQASTNILSI